MIRSALSTIILCIKNIFNWLRDVIILVSLGGKKHTPRQIYLQVIQKSTRPSNLFCAGSMYTSVSVFCFKVMKKASHILV